MHGHLRVGSDCVGYEQQNVVAETLDSALEQRALCFCATLLPLVAEAAGMSENVSFMFVRPQLGAAPGRAGGSGCCCLLMVVGCVVWGFCTEQLMFGLATQTLEPGNPSWLILTVLGIIPCDLGRVTQLPNLGGFGTVNAKLGSEQEMSLQL